MDARTEIRRAVDTGKVLFGYREVEKNVLKGKGKILILAKNLASKDKEKIEHFTKLSEIPKYEFNGDSMELGTVCGKPFSISAMLVIETGKSKVSEISTK